jgi:hypothetical protein
MDIVLSLPAPKFNNGQVVRLQNNTNNYGINILILKRSGLGEFYINDDVASALLTTDHYYVSVQEGSVADRKDATEYCYIIRPGTFLTLFLEDVENRGSVISWENKIIYTPDTEQNIAERTEKWDKLLGVWKQPLSTKAL